MFSYLFYSVHPYNYLCQTTLFTSVLLDYLRLFAFQNLTGCGYFTAVKTATGTCNALLNRACHLSTSLFPQFYFKSYRSTFLASNWTPDSWARWTPCATVLGACVLILYASLLPPPSCACFGCSEFDLAVPTPPASLLSPLLQCCASSLFLLCFRWIHF